MVMTESSSIVLFISGMVITESSSSVVDGSSDTGRCTRKPNMAVATRIQDISQVIIGPNCGSPVGCLT
jgi:hypothetical protein